MVAQNKSIQKMNTPLPLISCIMPTANREIFIPDSIQYFLKQDYNNKELIIVDDGINSVEQLIPQHDSIKYFSLNNNIKRTTGEKRNLACEKTSGEIIVHLDDDDWYATNWITESVIALQENNASICGLAELYFRSPALNKCWKYTYPSTDKPWVAGATMCYKKDLWRKHPFKNMLVGEDNDFVWNCVEKVFAHNFINGFIATIHSKNTSPKNPRSNRWQEITEFDVNSIKELERKS
jgi:glycosyltransferase involved in cell wall biosynthesis